MMDTQKCIWMDAGVVDYQLCPLKKNCDQCDFYKDMNRGHSKHSSDKEPLQIHLHDPIKSLVHFTPGLQYVKGHFWYKRVAADRIRIGIDSFLWQFFSSLQKVIIPKSQTLLLPRQCLSWIAIESGIIYLKTPVPGRIQKINPLFEIQDLQDAHLYLCPDHELWFVELDAFDLSNLVSLHKDEFLNMLHDDFSLFSSLSPASEGGAGRYGESVISKAEFSKYLLNISDNQVFIC
ncbi:MAG: hypothetical protein HQ507_02755 [Candidatus Marinimicrobia bacterium]|nr:hypothetical protein [Candidatus Neomarinimicrobiota bacterium]